MPGTGRMFETVPAAAVAFWATASTATSGNVPKMSAALSVQERILAGVRSVVIRYKYGSGSGSTRGS